MTDGIQSFIRFLGDTYSHLQTIEAERLTPKQDIKVDDPVKQAIIDMMTESTGCHMLDSGGAYGRSWQRNRQITNWDDLPKTSVDVWGDQFTVSISTYHFLYSHLDITNESRSLDKEFNEFMENRKDTYYPDDMVDFAKRFANPEGIINTCSFDNLLDHVLQFNFFENDDIYYLILQTHNGCDLRGGYAKPKIFALPEYDGIDHFLIHMTDVNAMCSKCGIGWYSDDSGYHWYGEDNFCMSRSLDGKRDLDFKYKIDENKNIIHKNCGGEIEVYTIYG